MEPNFKDGQTVWVNHLAFLFSKPKVGDVIIFQHLNKVLLKRVTQSEEDYVEVFGDNKSDNLEVGKIQRENIIGRVFR